MHRELLQVCFENTVLFEDEISFELTDQLAKLFQFFQITSNIIDVCLKKSVKKLTEQITMSSKGCLAGWVYYFKRNNSS